MLLCSNSITDDSLPSLSNIAASIVSSGPHKIEDSPRLIRVLLAGNYIFSSTGTKLVWEHPYYPQYYFPRSAIEYEDRLVNPEKDQRGFTVYDIRVGSVTKPKAAVEINTGPLAGFWRLDHKVLDGLFEEDDPIDGHPTDPYKRIDTRRSSRPIRVSVDGVVLADASWSIHLFETGLPSRYYMPRTSANWGLLKPSETKTFCPYKGEASYFDVEVKGERKKDLVWYYPNARMESLAVQGLVSLLAEYSI